MAQPLAKLAELEAMLRSALRGKPEAVNLSLVCLLARGQMQGGPAPVVPGVDEVGRRERIGAAFPNRAARREQPS